MFIYALARIQFTLLMQNHTKNTTYICNSNISVGKFTQKIFTARKVLT